MSLTGTAGIQARFVFRNLAKIKHDLDRWDSKRRPVAETAIRVELFRLRKIMQKDIRKGGIAGKDFAPLQVVTRANSYKRKPLSRLHFLVRYNVKKEGDKSHLSLGFDGPESTKKWRALAHRVQEGGDINPDYKVFGSTLRKLWRRVGGDWKKLEDKRGWTDEERLSKFYFLRKKTQKLVLPARPIIEPFWATHENETEKNIVNNFHRKMNGERI